MSYVDNHEIDFSILLFILSLALFSQRKPAQQPRLRDYQAINYSNS
jgi:hypothetical protein